MPTYFVFLIKWQCNLLPPLRGRCRTLHLSFAETAARRRGRPCDGGGPSQCRRSRQRGRHDTAPARRGELCSPAAYRRTRSLQGRTQFAPTKGGAASGTALSVACGRHLPLVGEKIIMGNYHQGRLRRHMPFYLFSPPRGRCRRSDREGRPVMAAAHRSVAAATERAASQCTSYFMLFAIPARSLADWLPASTYSTPLLVQISAEASPL